MYRNYEEYMRIVLGYKPMIQAPTGNPYINLYEDAKFNNMQFVDEQVRNQQSENNTVIEKKKVEGSSYQNSRQNQYQKQKEDKSKPAMSYKNFLKF